MAVVFVRIISSGPNGARLRLTMISSGSGGFRLFISPVLGLRLEALKWREVIMTTTIFFSEIISQFSVD